MLRCLESTHFCGGIVNKPGTTVIGDGFVQRVLASLTEPR